MSQIKTETWVGWFAASLCTAVVAIFIAVTFAYAEFETKDHAKENHEDLGKRLDRIENKVDQLLEQ